jgi:hypothetical protein
MGGNSMTDGERLCDIVVKAFIDREVDDWRKEEKTLRIQKSYVGQQ